MKELNKTESELKKEYLDMIEAQLNNDFEDKKPKQCKSISSCWR